MSRSYRTPLCKDHTSGMKEIHARKMRRRVRQILTEYRKTMFPEWNEMEFYFYKRNRYEDYWHLPMEPVIPHYRTITNQYDICDYRFWGSDPKYRRK
jgi:hypothetical protein